MQWTMKTSWVRRLGAGLLGLGMAFGAAAQIKGADVSWVSQQESAGQKFYSASGVQTDPFVLLKNLGTNAVRLRVWAKAGWNDGADVLYKAKRAKAQGMNIMVDFHYSDSWADPGQQTKPAAWAGHSYAQLKTDVYNHTYNTLKYLKDNGITVKWVQVGNETNSGMVWPEGKVSGSSFSGMVGLVNSGYDAVKAVYPSALVVLHLSNGYDNALYRWFFDGMKANGAKYDVIGMSHYPSSSDWTTRNSQIATNMSDMIARYGKSVVVSEMGMDWQQASASGSMIADLMSRVSALGSKGLGVFYWEPQASPGWQGYTWGALDNSGKFTAALNPY